MDPAPAVRAHRALIAARLPDLPLDALLPIGLGWTYDTYESGGWIVQVPRSAYGAARLRAQVALLPELAREVSAPIPVPEHISFEPDPPVMAYRRLEGTPCDQAPDGLWPERLGRFLYDLHMVPPEFVGLRGTSAEAIRAARREELDALAARILPLMSLEERTRSAAMLGAYLDDDALWVFAACLTHSDLGPEHVLVSPAGDLAGVIDWEEAGIGDPAWDFAWWLHAMAGPGERALAAYGGAPDRHFRERARLCYALMPWHEVGYGLDTGQDAFVRTGLQGARKRLPQHR